MNWFREELHRAYCWMIANWYARPTMRDFEAERIRERYSDIYRK